MKNPQKHFSLRTYLLIVVAVSWPFQIAYVLWAETPFMRYALSSLPMIMVTVATYLSGRYVFHDGFSKAGWSWGKSKQYLAVFSLASFVWVVPTILELVLGMRSIPRGVIVPEILENFLIRFAATLIPAFGEEFGWRGYMLPHLVQRYRLRTALLLHAFTAVPAVMRYTKYCCSACNKSICQLLLYLIRAGTAVFGGHGICL